MDAANLLPPQHEARLSDRLKTVEDRSKHQVVVVTVPSLGGHTIDDYGLHLGRTWGIGRKEYNDGVLLIVAPNERKVRIEVGYGLEKALTDDEAADIINDDILPAFRKRAVSEGIEAGTSGIIREIAPETIAS